MTDAALAARGGCSTVSLGAMGRFLCGGAMSVVLRIEFLPGLAGSMPLFDQREKVVQIGS
ncbi:hypothetical protein GCM10027405_38840 [Arthrobacter alkaliphilus]